MTKILLSWRGIWSVIYALVLIMIEWVRVETFSLWFLQMVEAVDWEELK